MFLNRLEPIILRELRRLREERQLASLARQMGFSKNRLSEFLRTDNPRKLTFYYLIKFIQGGIMPIKQVFRGKSFDDLTDDEKTIWFKLQLTDKDVAMLTQNGLFNLLKGVSEHDLKTITTVLKGMSQK